MGRTRCRRAIRGTGRLFRPGRGRGARGDGSRRGAPLTAIARWAEHPPAGWEGLLQSDANATPAHRPALGQALAAALPGFAPAFVVVEEGGDVIGGAPAMVERRAAMHWIHLMPFALPGTPLAVAGEHARVDRLVSDALERQAGALRAVGGAWVTWRPVGPEVEPAALERLAGETRTMTTAVVDLAGGVEAAWRGLDRDTRTQVRVARARGLEVREEPGALDQAYALYQMQARHWPGHRLRPLVLLRRLLEGEPPAARLFTVRDGRGLLAAGLALVGEWEWMLWWSGAHPEARRRHASALLMWALVEKAAAAGCRRFNLGGSAGLEGVAVFKHRLAARDEPVTVRWIGSAHAGPLGRVVGALQARLRSGRFRGQPR